MAEERKEYSIIGRVEIGTDEYRDLIEDVAAANKSADYYMRESWKKDEKVKELTEKAAELKKQVDAYKAFISKNMTNFPNDVLAMVFAEIGGE